MGDRIGAESSRAPQGSRGYRLARTALATVAIGVMLWLAGNIVLLCFAGLLIAVALRGASRFFQRVTRMGPSASLAVVVMLCCAVFIGGPVLMAQRAATQMDRVYSELTGSLDRLAGILENYEWGRWLLDRASSLDSMGSSGQGASLLSRGTEALGGVLSVGSSTLAFIIIATAIGIYLAAGFDTYVNGIARIIRPEKRQRIVEVFRASLHALEGWLLGQAVSMSVLGVASFIGLSLLGIPLALPFAIFTAVLTFVPNFGPFISVIPPVLLALTEGPMTAVYVVIFYIVLQNAEGLVITPLVQRRTAFIPPPLLLAVQVLMGALLGFLGLLFAAPLCAFVLVWVKLLYLEDRLKQHVEVADYESRW